jgi:hypothetical protein
MLVVNKFSKAKIDSFESGLLANSLNDLAKKRKCKNINFNITQGLKRDKLYEPAKGEMHVVYMGDSITDFWLRGDSGFFEAKPCLDQGISGQTTGQVLVRKLSAQQIVVKEAGGKKETLTC